MKLSELVPNVRTNHPVYSFEALEVNIPLQNENQGHREIEVRYNLLDLDLKSNGKFSIAHYYLFVLTITYLVW